MHVLMVTDRWNETGGGRERYLAELRASLIRRGRAVAVLVREPLGERGLRRRVETFRRSYPAASVMAASPASGATHYQLHSGVHAAVYDAERDYTSAWRRLFVRPALRMNPRRRRLLRLEARIFAADSTTKVMVFSNRSRDEIQRLFGVAADRVALARPGVDLGLFHPPVAPDARAVPPASSHRVRLLFAGHNFALKGLRWALEAAALARRRGVEADVAVAGRGPAAPFAALAHRLNIGGHVRFMGAVPQDVLADLYRRSDLLLHPAFYDPFPRVVVEALASGVPVVTTAACGGAEVIAHGQNGFVVTAPTEVDAIADAIGAVATQGRRAAMSLAAAETGRRFDFERHADAVADWLARA